MAEGNGNGSGNGNGQYQRLEPGAPAVQDDAMTLAVARIALANLQGTQALSWLSPGLFFASLIGTPFWLWNNQDLSSERTGYVFIGLIFSVYAVSMYSKRARDEQRADHVESFAKQTPMYHQSGITFLRGSEDYARLTLVGLVASLTALFGGIWMMTINLSSKWMLTLMCGITLNCTFFYANQQRNAHTAKSLGAFIARKVQAADALAAPQRNAQVQDS
jgi:hypothetical protein